MKKLKLLLPALLLSLFAFSQAGQINQINIISFTVKPVLPGNIDSWISTPGALIMVAQKVPNPRMVEPRLVIQIRSGSAVICGNNAATAKQVDPFDVRTFNTADLTGFLTNCHELKAGTYTICAQFFNIDKVAISREVCKDFRVEEANVEYAPPTLITPDNGKKFTAQELLGVVMFRWTPLVPKPKEPVTYRLKVWQLMQGQSGTTAMRTNQPIITKDVDNITQATANGIYTGPCKPPYLCDYIWNVQALNRSGKPMGNNNGMSEPYTFGAAEEKSKGPDNIFPEDKKIFTLAEVKKSITFKWRHISPTPAEPFTYRLRVWPLMQGQTLSNVINSTKAILDIEGNGQQDALTDGLLIIRYLETGPCKPPYLCDFVWNVEARSSGQAGAASKIIGTSEPTTFRVKEETGKGPDNIFPEDKKIFTLAEVKKSITFKWRHISPTPAEPFTYHLRVWPLMQGQTIKDAMNSIKPALDIDGNGQADALTDGLLIIRYLETGPCKPPYLCDFVWNVQAKTREGTIVGTSEPTVFSVKEETGKCPANTFPEDKKRLDLEEVKRSITFKWTKMETPGESSAYRLKVWQLIQGQNGTQAMKSNTPIVTKEVRNANEITVNGILTGPCKPPYLCDFIWAVEKISASGQVTCSSQPTMFFVTQYIIQLDSIKVLCTATPGVYSFKYCITNPNAGTAKLITFTATSSVPAGATIGTFSPPLNTTINSNGQLCITGTINGPVNLSNICIGAAIQDVANNFWQAQKDTCVKVEPCRCDACDEKNFLMNLPKPAQVNWNNNTLSFNQAITITTTPPKTIKSIKAELVYYEMIPQINDCLPCDKDASLYGHFTNGTNNQLWTGSQTSLSINITTPNVPCCSTVFKWCIRYKVEFTDCTVCSKLICYEKKKEGCIATGGDKDNQNNNPK